MARLPLNRCATNLPSSPREQGFQTFPVPLPLGEGEGVASRWVGSDGKHLRKVAHCVITRYYSFPGNPC